MLTLKQARLRKLMAKNFVNLTPTLEDYWRSIILFGRNTASFKFALANSLLHFGKLQHGTIEAQDLAEVFSRHLCEHLKVNDKQGTSASNPHLEVCRKFNAGEIDKDQLVKSALKDGFRYVFDAFHNIPGGALPVAFYSRESGRDGAIKLHDDFFKLLQNNHADDFILENEARWSLVETAWRLNLSDAVISLNYDHETKMIMEPDKLRRSNITSARDALNGYQKGHCFYCFSKISITSGNENLADVDHFFPHVLGRIFTNINFDGVWNLGLARQNCNRGVSGKFELIPTLALLERLHARNNFFIDSHHPLRETLIAQAGKSEKERISHLQNVYNLAITKMINSWEPALVASPRF